MSKEAFVDVRFSDETAVLIALADSILTEYMADGMRLTLRQLFYQLVSRGELPNTQQSYKRLGEHVGNARLAGELDWDAIEDRVRETVWPAHWSGPAEIAQAAASSFRIDKWADQPNHVEVMVEKDALSGVLEPACQELDVRFTANRGYSSLSHLYEVGKRIEEKVDEGKDVHILYFGDYDPSGLDMDRDVLKRIELFSGQEIRLERLALTREQIRRYNPPPNPAKMTDSRAGAYVAVHGGQSWELDALEPRVLRRLVTREIERLRDDGLWREAMEREETMRRKIEDFAANVGEDDEGAT